MQITTTPRRATSSPAIRLLVGFCCAAALATALGLLVPAALGLRGHVVTDSSSSGAFAVGSVVFAEVVPASRLSEGDVITYRPPPQSGIDHPVAHRIVDIQDGVYRTWDDAVDRPHPWTFTLDEPVQTRVRFHVPHLGHAFLVPDRAAQVLVVGGSTAGAVLLGLARVSRGSRRPGAPARSSRPCSCREPARVEAAASPTVSPVVGRP